MTSTHTKPKKTLIICVWMGSWPSYLPYFTKTAALNKHLNWLIISDQPEPPFLPANIAFKKYSLHDFNSLASDLLEIPVKISDPGKLCDFKPVYGLLFNSFLRDYDYWGYCDLDLILGDLEPELQALMDEDIEVISFYECFLSGPFCLFRNSDKTRHLFREILNYEEILIDPEHYALDENNNHRMQNLSDHSGFRTRLSYLASRVMDLSLFTRGLIETRYRYQWFLKRRTCNQHPPYDMTEAVWRGSSEGRLSVSFKDRIESDRSLARAGKKNWNITWKDGKLTDLKRNTEFPVFHFVDLKNRLENRNIDPETNYMRIPDEFTLDPDGFNQ